uniref:Uncharacterized protein n=1 Tax=viral metagenome TaxID=1070528 RepID=A0A6C0I4D4_9ZZZZ
MFKGLVSPFHSLFQTQTTKCKPQSRQPCNCDDDDDDCGMAPECAFLCTMGIVHKNKSHTTSKKRRSNGHHAHAHAKKTRTKKQ